MHSQLSGQPEPLAHFISEQIAQRGPVTVAQFMQWALYHPQYGYYMTGPNIGPRGDFTTSPEASPAFGKLLARHVAEVDALIGHPDPFCIVECGPGRGTLAGGLLGTLRAQHPSTYARTTYWLVEISPALSDAQRELLLGEHSDVCRWAGNLDDIPSGINGALLANEFIDAFPVYVLENSDGELKEQYVDAEEAGGLRISLGSPSDGALLRFVHGYGIDLKSGERMEVNLAMHDWLQLLGSKLQRGVAAIFDYGDTQPARYSEARKQGTLLGYYGGSVTHSILDHPGKQDLTALVDFTALKDAAEGAGLTQLALTRQANFLLGLGLGTSETAESAGEDIEAILGYRRGLQALVSMEGLGRFHVSALSKGVDPAQARTALSALQYAEIR